jgi:hypothetical protein
MIFTLCVLILRNLIQKNINARKNLIKEKLITNKKIKKKIIPTIKKKTLGYIFLGILILIIIISLFIENGIISNCKFNGALACDRAVFQDNITKFNLSLREGYEDIYLISIRPTEYQGTNDLCYINKGTVNPVFKGNTSFEIECRYSDEYIYEFSYLDEVGKPNSIKEDTGEVKKPFWK